MTRQRVWAAFVAGGMLGLIGLIVTDVVVGQQVIKVQAVAQPGDFAQPIPPNQPPGTGPGSSIAAQLSSVKIIEKSEFRQVINVARDCVKDKAWEEGVTALQALLDNKEDHYVQVRDRDAQGREMLRWTS